MKGGGTRTEREGGTHHETKKEQKGRKQEDEEGKEGAEKKGWRKAIIIILELSLSLLYSTAFRLKLSCNFTVWIP